MQGGSQSQIRGGPSLRSGGVLGPGPGGSRSQIWEGRYPVSVNVISRFQSNSNVFYLINCGNKSKSFLSFISFIVVSQHRVQVSCTSSHTSQI